MKKHSTLPHTNADTHSQAERCGSTPNKVETKIRDDYSVENSPLEREPEGPHCFVSSLGLSTRLLGWRARRDGRGEDRRERKGGSKGRDTSEGERERTRGRARKASTRERPGAQPGIGQRLEWLNGDHTSFRGRVKGGRQGQPRYSPPDRPSPLGPLSHRRSLWKSGYNHGVLSGSEPLALGRRHRVPSIFIQRRLVLPGSDSRSGQTSSISPPSMAPAMTA